MSKIVISSPIIKYIINIKKKKVSQTCASYILTQVINAVATTKILKGIKAKTNTYIFCIEREELIRMETLKVGTKSNPNSVAGALANVFREKGEVEIQAIGAGALNQAIKAIAIARGFVAPSGKNLVCIPAFSDIVIDGEDRTAIKLIVEAK